MKLRYTPRAKLDIAEIHDYIAQENSQAAKRIILLIRKAAESLPQNPQVGRIAGTRELSLAVCVQIPGQHFNPNSSLAKNCVIPAQAGIQLIEKSSRSEPATWFCPLRGVLFLLDSRLRGNDGANELFWFNASQKQISTSAPRSPKYL